MGTTVVTTAGRVEGSELPGLSAFLGIPYGTTVRWQPPVPATAWSGSRDATRFGFAAPQTEGPPSPLPALDPGPQDEECLTLNVWAPREAHDLPVLVWIHGGGFVSGSSAVPSYSGARLAAEQDVVVVSINYRLGALGFAPVSGLANVGLLDQLLALEWVRDNIDAFGGDPDLVTVFGESAGGGSIMHLLASPSIGGLVRRAIVQSGATTLSLTADGAAAVADRFVDALPFSPETAPVGAILQTQDKVAGELVASLGAMPFHPATDGDLVASNPLTSMSQDIDLLVGTTANELNTYLDPAAATLERERLVKRAARYVPLFGSASPELVVSSYGDLASPSEVWAAMRTDAEMWLPALTAASHAGRAFMYRFDWPSAVEWLGACHAIDIPFTFDSFDQEGWADFVGYSPGAAALGRAVRESWALFARTGDPSSPSLGGWPAYEAGRRATMVLGTEPAVVNDPRSQVREAWGT